MLTINLQKHSAVRNGIPIIIDGQPVNGYKTTQKQITIRDLESAYQQFKTSVPSESGISSRYFYAKSASELTTDQLITGMERTVAKEQLELMVLESILNNSIVWPDDQKWFWQPGEDPDFVLLKEWF